MEKSISEYFYSEEGPKGHKCGYCKSRDGSVSHGMWTHRLTVEDYQDLIDRGWRRSGKYCYKPLMSESCCPAYAISCQATKFRLSNSQRQVLKRMNKYLAQGVCKIKKASGSGSSEAGSSSKVVSTSDCGATGMAKVKRTPVRPGEGADPSKPPCRKAKLLRQERREKKLQSSGTITSGKAEKDGEGSGTTAEPSTTSHQQPQQDTSTPDFMRVEADGRKPLEAFLATPSSDTPNAHTLEIKLIRSHPPSAEFKSTFEESYAIYKKYQMSVHKDSEKDCERSTYTRFLCDSPLIPAKGREGWPCDYGSYHQQYRIDGRLVAVGVIDVLPKCLSSVYVFYDPDSDFLELGVYSALRELEFTRRLHLGDPSRFLYYYMGYYIHACQKMRYKGNYTPSYLLCPESYKFVPIESCRPKLDVKKYSRLNEEEEGGEGPEDVTRWLGDVLVLMQRTYMSYAELSQYMGDVMEAKVREYATLVGPKVAPRMLLVLES